ncbi:MAG: dihydroorotate dehydrogenase electron transfer subunit [Roseburia sp.]|nr:dihydroorotate dehydrogenase electron transfer subunit [Roseburia sp.]
MKQKITAVVISQKEIAPQIYDMWIGTKLAEQAKPGQFICVYPKDKSTLLPRPISICEVSEDRQALRIVYRIAGQGTKEFSSHQAGASIDILGILGNGFPLEEAKGKKVFLMGGGIGIPPMLELAKELAAGEGGTRTNTIRNLAAEEMTVEEKTAQETEAGDREEKGQKIKSEINKCDLQIMVGYRDSHTFLREDLERYGTVYMATEDGSVGTKGNVMDAIAENNLDAGVIYACGPMPMLRAVKAYASEKQIPAYLSLEEHMACGVGACLGCVAKTKEVHPHSHVQNARICTDGPVFEAGEVEI